VRAAAIKHINLAVAGTGYTVSTGCSKHIYWTQWSN